MMHKFEQLVFGVPAGVDGGARTVLGASPGIRADLRDEIARLCERWGTPPVLGMEHPGLVSMPLENTTAALPGRLWAVVRIGRGLEPVFHAVVVTDNTFTTFLRNPYALAREIPWIEEWPGEVKLVPGEVAADPTKPLADPPAGPDDMGLVDEALLKYLIDGHLHLPIERPGAESDRCLCLLIACLPEKDRKELRFASFAPHGGNEYGLSAPATENCHFAGWKRLLSAWIAGDYREEIEQYVAAVREFLPTGDMAGVSRVSMRVSPRQAGGGSDGPVTRASVLETRRGVTPEPPASPPPRPAAKTAPPPKPAAASAATPGPGATRPRTVTPTRGPTGPSHPGGPGRPAGRPGIPDSGGVITRSQSGPAASTPAAAPRRSRAARSSARRRPRLPILRVGALTLVLAATVFTGMNWLDGKTLAESLMWANIGGWMPDMARTERAPTLLEVVDVGLVYDKQLKLVGGGSGIGFKPSADQGRRKAMANLRDRAAGPLEDQVRLFAKLAADGIQQGGRPDREIQRMGSLADQGAVIRNEIERLELAYYSLASATYWRDLNALDDREVSARRDSLQSTDRDALDDACGDLWSSDPRPVLADALTSVNGMSALLDLFQAEHWSPAWEKRVEEAAGKVSPTASTMTRAYRNSAFSFLRIKKAERHSAHRDLPYRDGFGNGVWPSPEIAAALPALRAQVRNFESGHVPSVLSGVLDLYVDLKSARDLAKASRKGGQALAAIEKNPAYRFHPEAYRPFVERIRYEAVLAGMGEQRDPSLVPESLCPPGKAELVAVFADTVGVVRDPAVWEALAGDLGDPFLSDWAAYRGRRSGARLAKVQEKFDAAWSEAVGVASALRVKAVQGEDWSAEWRGLDTNTRAILSDFARELAVDSRRSGTLATVSEISAALHRPLPLRVEAVTVRLDQDKLAEPTDVLVEMRIVPGGPLLEAKVVPVGPAAPAGSGWVGTVSVAWETPLGPKQGLVVRVSTLEGDQLLLEASCPSLAEGGGPGHLSRPLTGTGGSLGLKAGDGYWEALRVPGPEVVF